MFTTVEDTSEWRPISNNNKINVNVSNNKNIKTNLVNNNITNNINNQNKIKPKVVTDSNEGKIVDARVTNNTNKKKK